MNTDRPLDPTPDDDWSAGEEDPGAGLGDPVVSEAMRGESALDDTPMKPANTERPAMAKQQCDIIGTVTYREGDGVEMEVPKGPCQIEVTDLDVTLSWAEGESHGSAAISLQDYRRFVAEGALKVS